MFGLGAGELFVIFALALILIGPKKLPELARGLGKAIREFQNTKNDLLQEVHKPSNNDQKLETSQTAEEKPQKTAHPII